MPQTNAPREIRIDMDGTYMNVIRFGSGEKALAVISGVSLCGLEGMAEQVAAAYSMFADRFTVYLFDRKKVLPPHYTTRAMAEDVYRALTYLGVSRAGVYGVSHGGMIAQCLAAAHPELVARLALCSTLPKTGDTMKAIADRWVDLASKGDVVALNRFTFDIVYSQRYLDAARELLPALEKQGTKADCDRFAVLAEACGCFDIGGDLDKIARPALVLGDENDRVLGIEGTRELARRLHTEPVIYSDYSHAVYDEAEDVKARVFAFMSADDGKRGSV